MKILFVSLGCDKNRVDSEYMLGMLRGSSSGMQLEITDDETQADIIVVNTCCFIGDARDESVETILQMADLKAAGSCRVLIVCGCLAERYREDIITEIPEVDAVIGTNSIDRITEAVQSVLGGERYQSYEPLTGIGIPDTGRVISTGGHYSYLKMAEGCDKHCTYCIIPSLRGSYRSVPLEDLCKEADELAAQGVRELILVAQETTVYGTDLYGKKMLPALLDRLNQIPGLAWIRILYCYPEEIDDDLLDAIVRNEKVCHYLDMPIQHINSGILKRMGRRTSREDILRVIDRIRERIPDMALRTTVICGFPGETQKEHEELMRFMNETEFDRLGAFAYSQEDDTPAAAFPDQCTEEEKQARMEEAMELQAEIIADMNEDRIGEVLAVMIEGKVADEPVYIGRTYRDAPDVDGYIFVNADYELMSGDFVTVKVTGAYEYDLIGDLIED